MRAITLSFYWVGFVVCLWITSQSSWGEIAADRIPLVTGELIIPSYFQPGEGEIDLVFHMHCSPEAAGESLIRSGINAVMIAVHIGSFSSPYQNYFSDPRHFFELLDQSLSILKTKYPTCSIQWNHICITAFSGGYGGARELVRNPEIYDLIDSLILLDCPHTSYTDDKQVYPPQIEGFLRFAQDAVAEKKTFIMTHSEIVPGTYASTTECADYLIAGVNGKRIPWTGTNEMGMIRNSQCTLGRFSIYGFKGDTTQDHMKHLHGMYLFLRQIDFGL